ncbi:MAG: DNA polymerase III [Candidatus Wildermuthbacteria bacterium RIFCSPHIGHO2_02_FULL_49_9]|uniref:DNA polymerase beta n=2 Tax=Candidatus Wildermuthiibacteriota TaxID=1817923 RepID=A0A1G2QYR6_9BACT|nr:MAG: DNA polymerase III [Candidatus Wildermuthbacteria bacterium RIFCSPHIGHO2_01_FULL_49_22b]OHA70538.1 MAG: DNA polymerase III [Candidatus Wildermuthbacteria bacterium RIFCSPHIGHO2_02_FULL_49_9]
MANRELSRIFSELALYLEMDSIPFKPRSYEKAAEALNVLSDEAEEIYQKEGPKGLEGIPGVGKGIAEKIAEYLETGKIHELEQYRKKMPTDIEKLTLVEGIGPKMVKELWGYLKIKNLKDLEKAARAGRVAGIPGFGPKKEQNILQGIGFLKRSEGRWLLHEIYPVAQRYAEELKASGLVRQAVPAGSLRRMKETIGDIDILVSTKQPGKAMDFFLNMVPHEKVWGKGRTKTSVRSTQGFDVDVRVVPENVFGAALQYFTGSKEHNVRLRTLAAKKGFKLSEYGLFSAKGGSAVGGKGKKLVACKTEKSVYRILGIQEPEPELREDRGEVQAALLGKLPKLIPYGSLKGDLQVQTDWTDGRHSIEEMARESKKQGLSYIAITDHTRDLAMTGGLDEKKLRLQMAEIDRINSKSEFRNSRFRVLKGAEVNIRKDGSLDIEDELLAKLDVVGASVHSNFRMSKNDMTKRIVRAMKSPHVDILFHPTGRWLLKREAYEADMEEIIREAQKTGTALEVNASVRMDLKDADIRKAVEAGVKLAIDSDAHDKSHFRFLRFGIAQARRGWAKASDVMNTRDVVGFLGLLKKK